MEKKEFKVGDNVYVKGTVVDLVDSDGDIYVESAGGKRQFLYADDCTLVGDDELQVGEEVETTGGNLGVIESLLKRYHVKFRSGGFGTFSSDHLTRVPPKPTYRWEYQNDALGVYGDKGVCFSIQMLRSPEAVEEFIESMNDRYDLDADEARKLIAVPKLLGMKNVNGCDCEAWRHATGWRASIPYSLTYNSEEIVVRAVLPEGVARDAFDIKGPYLFTEKP